jgi:hypothetical protein
MTHHRISTRRRGAALAAAALAASVAIATGCAADPSDPASARSPGVEDVIDVRAAPWADQSGGSPALADADRQPSIVFPPGVGYAEALDALFRSARAAGTTPRGTVVRDPLPARVVYVAPASRDEGLRLSLTAPFGWAGPEGRVLPPSVSLPGGLAPEEASRRIRAMLQSGAVLPEGGRVDVPLLPACAVADGTPEEAPPCD